MIGAPDLTLGTEALNTFWRQFGLLLGNEIRQSLAYFGIREDPLTVLADEGPGGHRKIVATSKGRENTQFRVPFSCELVERILLLTVISLFLWLSCVGVSLNRNVDLCAFF
jgi:hypothetical protein